MKAPNVSLTAGGIVALIGVAVVGYVAFRGYQAFGAVAKKAGEVWDKTAAVVSNAADAVALKTDLPDSAYADPAAQEQANAIYGRYTAPATSAQQADLDRVAAASTGGATGSW